MKTFAPLFVLMLLVGCRASLSIGTTGGSDDHVPAEQIASELEQMMEQSAEDWTNDDLDAFMLAFHQSPELTFAIPTGITKGWGPLKERYAKSIDKSNLWFTDIQTTIITDDTALVFARFHNVMKEDQSYSTGLTTLLCRKIDGRWVIIHDHSSGLPKDTPRKDR